MCKKSTRHNIVCGLPHSLLRFLIRNKVLHIYVNNCVKRYDSFVSDDIKKLYLIRGGYGCISSAFMWLTSPEGNIFWERKYLEYCIFMRSNQSH